MLVRDTKGRFTRDYSHLVSTFVAVFTACDLDLILAVLVLHDRGEFDASEHHSNALNLELVRQLPFKGNLLELGERQGDLVTQVEFDWASNRHLFQDDLVNVSRHSE